MKCNLTKDCPGTLQIEPEQDDAIKYSLKCNTCGERKIVQRTREELIDLFQRRVTLLRAGIDIQSIYEVEAGELLHFFVAEDEVRYLPIAESLIQKHFPPVKNITPRELIKSENLVEVEELPAFLRKIMD